MLRNRIVQNEVQMPYTKKTLEKGENLQGSNALSLMPR